MEPAFKSAHTSDGRWSTISAANPAFSPPHFFTHIEFLMGGIIYFSLTPTFFCFHLLFSAFSSSCFTESMSASSSSSGLFNLTSTSLFVFLFPPATDLLLFCLYFWTCFYMIDNVTGLDGYECYALTHIENSDGSFSSLFRAGGLTIALCSLCKAGPPHQRMQFASRYPKCKLSTI